MGITTVTVPEFPREKIEIPEVKELKAAGPVQIKAEDIRVELNKTGQMGITTVTVPEFPREAIKIPEVKELKAVGPIQIKVEDIRVKSSELKKMHIVLFLVSPIDVNDIVADIGLSVIKVNGYDQIAVPLIDQPELKFLKDNKIKVKIWTAPNIKSAWETIDGPEALVKDFIKRA